MDVKMAAILKKNTRAKPFNQVDHHEEMRDGFIQKQLWGVVYKVDENRIVKNYMMFLQDKHCFRSTTLIGILTMAEILYVNKKIGIKCVSNMLRCWMIILIMLLGVIPQVFGEVK